MENALRNDFRYRFLPFYVPSLYERREDALYYLHHKFPDLIPTLTFSEVLSLLAYHWPGNVREINRVGFLMQMHKMDAEELQFDSDHHKSSYESSRLQNLDERYTFLDSSLSMDALMRVKSWNGDIKLLEQLLNKNRVGLSDENLNPAFHDFDPLNILYGAVLGDTGDEENYVRKMEKRLGITLFPALSEFDQAYNGYTAFCGLFGQDPFKNRNILSDLENADINHFDISGLKIVASKKRAVERLFKAIMRAIKGISVEGFKYPDDPFEYWQVLEDQKQKYDSDDNETANIAGGASDIWCLEEDELRKMYYEGLLKKTGGNVRMASKLAGVNETTFRSRMDALQVNYKKSHRNK
jgi:DNA-binding NtrC family response regulator